MPELPLEPKPGRFNVVIETPKGSRSKFNYVHASSIIKLGKQLPAGAVFPYDFGFLPSTRAPDGDPIDVLLLMETPTFPGCLVRARLIGVIDAEQSSKQGRMVRNPRLVAVGTKAIEYKGVKKLSDLPPPLIEDIEHFFIAYNERAGKKFKVLGHGGRKRAIGMARNGRIGRLRGTPVSTA